MTATAAAGFSFSYRTPPTAASLIRCTKVMQGYVTGAKHLDTCAQVHFEQITRDTSCCNHISLSTLRVVIRLLHGVTPAVNI